VCDNAFTQTEANAVCRQLGFSAGAESYSSGVFGVGTGPIVVNDISCSPTDTRLDQCTTEAATCPTPILNPQCAQNAGEDCVHSEDAGVTCCSKTQSKDPTSTCYSAPVSVHGDPMFKVNGTGTHFWLQAGVLSPLLVWTALDGSKMQLAGKTFHSEDALNQWFNQFVIKRDGQMILDVNVKDSAQGSRQLSGTMDVKVDGKVIDPLSPKPVRGALMYSSAKAAVSATLSKKNDGFSDVLATTAGGLKMSIYSSKAIKFNSSKVSNKYMHLNIKFDEGLPAGSSGVFTELAGNKKLSEATRALLMPPKGALAALHKKDLRHPGLLR